MINELGIHTQHIISLMPKSGPCYDFQGETVQNRKTIWLVPHVIKLKTSLRLSPGAAIGVTSVSPGVFTP